VRHVRCRSRPRHLSLKIFLNAVQRTVTLMRTIKLLLLGIVVLAGFTSTAAAQPAVQNWTDRGYFNVSLGGQSREQEFEDSSTFTIYGETGAVASAHSIGGGTLFDIGAGARVWRNLGIGIGYSRIKNKNDATVSVRVPHPVVFGQSRVASATASDLEHTENAVHLQFLWMLPLTSKFQVAFMVGPSFFTVRQEVATVRAPQDISDVAPFTSVSISSITVTDVKDSPVGVNVGVDGTYLVTRMIGVGAFVRYAGASLDLPVESGVTRNADLNAGGTQAGIGLRLRF
jgi:hypothetical protein